MTTTKAWLADRGVVQGRRRGRGKLFLDGLLTNDVEALTPGEARHAARCSRRKARSCST